MLVNFAVSFEHEKKPVRTHQGTAKGLTPADCAEDALKQARKAYPRVEWESLVIVLDQSQKLTTTPGEGRDG